MQEEKARLESHTAKAQAQTHTLSFKAQLERRKTPFLRDSLFSQHPIEARLLQWDLNLTDLQFPPSLLLFLLLPGHSLGSLSFRLPSVFLLFLLGQVLKVSSDAACFISNCNMEENSGQIMSQVLYKGSLE